MITGGYTGSVMLADVLEYDSSNLYNEPEKLKSMIYSRRYHACTIFNSILHEGRPILLSAGSWTGSGENTAEIFDFKKEGSSWQESNLIFASILSVYYIFQIWANELTDFYLALINIILFWQKVTYDYQVSRFGLGPLKSLHCKDLHTNFISSTAKMMYFEFQHI